MKPKLIIIFFVISTILTAQNRQLEANLKLTISEGLAHNGVTSILEDSKGFLWFGTYDGINRYDGYKLLTFKNNIDNNILTSNRVRALTEDVNGNLWIGTDEGVTIYDYSLNKFNKLHSNKDLGNIKEGPIVRQILIDGYRDLVLCTTEGNGILIFDTSYNFLGTYVPDWIKKGQKIDILEGIRLGKDAYVFSSSSGLLFFDLSTKKFKKVLEDQIKACNSIASIDDNLLLLTLPRGLLTIKYQIEHTPKFGIVRRSLTEYQFVDAMVDFKGSIWLGTLNQGILKLEDIDVLHRDKPIFKTFTDNLTLLRSSCFLSTSKNSCWLATFNEGVYRFDINESPFKSYNAEMNYRHGLSSNHPNYFSSIDRDRVYMSSSSGGLALFNTKTNHFEPLKYKAIKQVADRVSTVYVDSKKNIWLRLFGSNDFIYRFRTGSDGLEQVELEDLSLFDVFPGLRSFAEDKFGNIWIGGSNDVYKISISSKNDIIKIETLNSNPFFKGSKVSLVRRVYTDPSNNFIWLGTDANGLYRIKYDELSPIEDLEVDQFTKENNVEHGLTSNFISSIIRLPNDEMWIGTEGGGICKVEDSDTIPKFLAFTEKNGLSNNVVKTILYDNQYNLWIATNIGLNKFSTKDFSFRNFSASDGLPFEDFWFESEQLNNGTILLSGLDGFCYFKPEDVSKNDDIPKFELENFKIFNKTVRPKDSIGGRVLLDKIISNTDEIKLKHNENVFSIDIISLHYSNPKNHFLRYKLEPINEQWLEVPSNLNTINYNGLQPGEYTLSVTASNSSKEWTKPKTIKIIVDPPFWRTNLAYFVYFIITILVIYTIVRVVYKIQSLHHKVEIEQLTNDNIKEINEEKLRFFSNISHEIKTPLTLLSGPISMLSSRFKNDQDATDKLKLMQRQSKKIHQLIEQVHDFRRADANLLKINYSRFNFHDFVNELIEDFNFLASKDQKQLNIIGEESRLIVTADKDMLEKVFNNLLNNAFKYTNTNHSITLEYKSEDKDLIVSVTDTGKGIDSVDLEHVFERFYQSHKKQNVHSSGSGIGLAFAKRLVEMHYGYIDVESEINVGTKITVRLPIVKPSAEDEKLSEDAIILPKEEEVTLNEGIVEKSVVSEIEVSEEFSDAIIFYAEDNLEMRTFVTELLSKWFEVKSFRNGQECLDALEDEWPDIVISDVQMPELNGLDLCIKIKSDLKTSHIPVILLTALTNLKDHLQGIRDGADSYIKKPFNIQELVTTIEALLANRKQLRERYQIGIPLTKENKNNRNDNAFLDKLYSLMEANLDNQNLDLSSLARELFLNRTHFFKKVKALTNQTPFELVKNYRLKRASELLVQKQQLSVNDVFVLTGFKSRTHFAKIFREKFGVSPGKYASEQAKKNTK